MERAAKAIKSLPAPTPARAPVRPHPVAPVTAAAALQSRIGASGVHKMLAGHAHSARAKAPPGSTRHEPDSGAKPAHADGKKGHGVHKKKDGAELDAKAKAPAPVDGGGAEGGGGEQAAEAKVKLHIPEPPTKPSKATMGRIAGVKGRAGGTAAAQGTLPDAASQVGDAQKAVTPPDAERLAEARAQLIAQVNAAPSPAIVKLCERIRQVIRDKRPPDEDALAEADPDKAATEAGSELNTTVQNESKKVEDNYQSLQTPGTAPPVAAAPPLTPQPAAAETAPVGAKSATPDAVPAGNVSLDKDAEDARKKADTAGMNKPAAALVQSGPVAETRAAQGELDDLAKTDPGKVLAEQKEALAKANADMGALQLRALAALTADRTGTVGQANEHKKGMVGSEAQMREQAGIDAKAAFDEAQGLVKDLLKDLVPNAMQKWETAKASLTTQFKTDLKIVKERVDDRHSGASGFVVGLWDAVTGLPGWATEAYDKAENNFGDGVIAKLTEISTEVDAIIKACEALIKKARDRIAEIFNALPASLKEWAAGEQTKFNGQLDKLGQEVHATQESFNKDLAGRASQAVDEVRTEIAELRKKAGGLIGRIVDAVGRFLDDPVKFIIEGLLELLGISPPAFWAVIAKIKKVASDIVDDPMGFANNLMSGIGQGFSQFFDNFAGHMLRGFLSWLLGDLKDVQIPKDLSLKSIITFFLQIMGITWPNIRKIIAKKIGEKNVALIEKVWSLVSVLMDKGPEGIFEMIKEKLDPQAIVDQVVQMAVEYMVTAIAKQVAIRIALLFNPAGAILQAIEAIYRVLKWVFQNAARIFTLIETIVNGLADIIAGNIGGFANAVEKGLEMLIAPVLGFIADYFSLGDLPKMVAKQIKGFREWILGMIEKAFDWVIEKGKSLLAALGIGGKDKNKKTDPTAAAVGEDVEFEAEGEQHHLWIEMHGATPTVMLASETTSMAAFLSGSAVKLAVEQDPSIGKKVGVARTHLSSVDTAAKAQVNQAAQTQAPATPAPAAGGGAVSKEERALADAVREILVAMANRQEPFAGLHGVIKQVSAKDVRNSHHVPARAFGRAVATTFESMALTLQQDPWRNNSVAKSLATAYSARAKQANGLATGDGDQLSAISLTQKGHKGDAGAHSLESAHVIAALAKRPDASAIPAVKRETLNDLKNYVSVNPRSAAWRAWLGEVHQQINDKKRPSTPETPRDNRDAAFLILERAQAAFEAGELADDKFVREQIMDKVNQLILRAVPAAHESGAAVVASSMHNCKEGTKQGQDAALADLNLAFQSSWEPFQLPFNV